MTTTLREQVADAMDVAWRHTEYPLRADGMSLLRELSPAAIGVVLGVVADEIKALYAKPPCEGAYRNEPGGIWFVGTGDNRSGMVGYDPSEVDVLALLERLRG